MIASYVLRNHNLRKYVKNSTIIEFPMGERYIRRINFIFYFKFVIKK